MLIWLLELKNGEYDLRMGWRIYNHGERLEEYSSWFVSELFHRITTSDS
jgi:hypothetical protein